MIREDGPGITRDDRSVVTTGTFDGVHLGHRAIVAYLVERAREIGGVPTVVTFSPHPREVITGQRVPLLTTLDERAALLERLGVERFVVLPFSRALSQLSAEDYVRDVLLGGVGMQDIVVGYDHRFGRGREGSRETLERIGAESSGRGFSVDVIPEQVYGDGEGTAAGVTVSSSAIRRMLLDDGDARGASDLLGRPYRLSGLVVKGDQRGRTIGFPTANVQPYGARPSLSPRRASMPSYVAPQEQAAACRGDDERRRAAHVRDGRAPDGRGAPVRLRGRPVRADARHRRRGRGCATSSEVRRPRGTPWRSSVKTQRHAKRALRCLDWAVARPTGQPPRRAPFSCLEVPSCSCPGASVFARIADRPRII